MIYDHFVWGKMMKANEKYFIEKLQCPAHSIQKSQLLLMFSHIYFVIDNVKLKLRLFVWLFSLLWSKNDSSIILEFFLHRVVRCGIRAHVSGVYIPWKWVVKIHWLFSNSHKFGLVAINCMVHTCACAHTKTMKRGWVPVLSKSIL